jgi:hypothetical protein
MDKTYYLFGQSASVCYDEYEDKEGNILHGTEAVIQAEEDGECTYETFCFIDGVTTPTMLLESYQGWSEYTIITEEEFNKLN